MKERLAISGSHGFLGENLVRYMEQQGHDVVRLGRKGGLIPPVDYIFDLATYGNLYEHRDPSRIYEANVSRLIRVLQNNNHQDYKAFIVVSTSSVDLPYQTFYSASKWAAEDIARIWARENDKPIVVIRPYSITGVGEQKEHLIPKLLDSCLNDTQIHFVPHPVHDFIDVMDVVRGLWIVAQVADNMQGQVIPIGSGIQYSNQEVLDIVEKVTGKRANIRYADSLRPYDTYRWVADTTKIKVLGWEPKISLEESIRRMYEQRVKG